jgi:TusA-related sulfurtransferase
MKAIDCRGLACPAPVLTAKEAIEREGLNELSIVVDNEAAKQNVSRFLKSQHFEVSVQEDGNDFRVTGRREGPLRPEPPVAEAPETVWATVTTNWAPNSWSIF